MIQRMFLAFVTLLIASHVYCMEGRLAPLVIDDYSARDLARGLRDALKQTGKPHDLIIYEGNEALFLIVPNPEAKTVRDISDEPSTGPTFFIRNTEHKKKLDPKILKTEKGAESLVADMQSHLQTSGSRFSLMRATSDSLTLMDNYLRGRKEWFLNRVFDDVDAGEYTVASLSELLEAKYGLLPHLAEIMRGKTGANKKVVIGAGDTVRDAVYQVLILTRGPAAIGYQLKPTSRKGGLEHPVPLNDIGGWHVLSL